MSITTINPATEQVIKEYPEMSEQEVKAIIDSTHQAYLNWRKTSFEDRAHKMRNAANILNERKQEFAEIITCEMGKPISAAKKEIEKCAWVCDHFADNAEEYLKPRTITTEFNKSYVTYAPLGIVFAIMPWNFPFWQVFRFAAPTLMAGNAALLKHAPISTGAGLAIESIFKEAGFLENLFRTLVLSNEGAAKVITNPKVIAVTLTGSAKAGSIVGANAAGALKKVVLELGGSDPYIILEDADLDAAAEACVTSRMNNSGQVCIAAKRLLAVAPIREPLQAKILEKLERYKMQDPMQENSNFGPMARKDLRDEVDKQVAESVKKGATLVKGGKIPSGKGFYYPPTVLTNVKPGMPAYDEEIFGPVIIFIDVKDEKEAIQIANDTSYGLAGAVFTQDVKKGEKIAVEELEAGATAVNTYVASDPRLPFGGIKHSGYGRELSAEGIKAFVNVKTIIVK